MNRGVIAYMREGTRCAKNTFKNFVNNFKYYFVVCEGTSESNIISWVRSENYFFIRRTNITDHCHKVN